MELIGCKFAAAGWKVKLLREDMYLHENDASLHISFLLEALQKAEERIVELEENQVIAQNSFTILENFVTTIITESVSSPLLFNIPIPAFDDDVVSTTINISGHNFRLKFTRSRNEAGWHSMYYIKLLPDSQRISSIVVKVAIELVSHSGFHPDISPIRQHRDVIRKTDEICYWGYENFVETALLNDERYIKDEQISFKERITVK
jgi:hypothetical protein